MGELSAPVKENYVTGLGWPKRLRTSRLLGWPRVSRETVDEQPRPRHAAIEPAADTEVDTEVDRELNPGDERSVLPEPADSAEDAETVSGGDHGLPGGVEELGEAETESPVAATHAAEALSADAIAQEGAEQLSDPDEDEATTDATDAVAPPAPYVSRETRRPEVEALPRPSHPRIFVVANQKGGVGKTTTAVNLAAGLAMGGLKVLLIDLDPQGNASTALGIDHLPGTPGTYEVLISGSTIAEHVKESTEAPGLMVLPATVDLAGAEIELVSVVARENRLNRALRQYLKTEDVDYVFLDCPPSLGLLTLNALVAAGEILIPIQCEYYALEGVSQLMNTINLVKGELNDDLDVSTVLLTMYDARTRLAAQVADEVRTHFAAQTLPGVIPRSVRISEAPSYGQTVLTYHPDSAGARCYLDAAREIARRGQEI